MIPLILLLASIPLRWTVETSSATPAVFDAYQGETLDFEAALMSYGEPLNAPSEYSFFWQTNGMGAAYWSTPCAPQSRGAGASSPASNLLFATWSPTNDCGARVYNCFIGAPGSIYHAAFQLRLRPSPGATPGDLPLPTPTIDFSRVTVLHSPYPDFAALNAATTSLYSTLSDSITTLRADTYTKAETDTAINSAVTAAGAVTPTTVTNIVTDMAVTTETDPTVPAWAKNPTPPVTTETDPVYSADKATLQSSISTLNSAISTKASTTDLNDAISTLSDSIDSKRDMTNLEIYGNAPAQWIVTRISPPSAIEPLYPGTYSMVADLSGWRTSGTSWYIGYDTSTQRFEYRLSAALYSFSWVGVKSFETTVSGVQYRISYGASRITYPVVTDSLALTSDIPDPIDIDSTLTEEGSAADAAAVGSALSSKADSADVTSLSTTVDAWQTYWDGDDVRLTVTNYFGAVDDPSLYIEQKITEDNTNYYRTVWTETNRLAKLSTRVNSLEAEIDQKADRAFGIYDSATGFLSPDDTLQLTQGKVLISKGLAYEKYFTAGSSSFWIMTATDPLITSGDDETGSFTLHDADGTEIFSVVKGDKRVVGATATGITVEDGVCTVPYSIESETHPTMYISTTLSVTPGEWKAEGASGCPATVSWSGSSGAWTATVTAVPPSDQLFMYAMAEVGSDTYIRHAAPTKLTRLIIGDTTYTLGTATISGSTVLTLTPVN